MPKKAPRLLFTEEERQAPQLKRAVNKADKAAARLEKAEANIPKKRVKKKQRYHSCCYRHNLLYLFLLLRYVSRCVLCDSKLYLSK